MGFFQYLTSFRSSGTPADGLFLKQDGTVWIRNPDGSETQVGAGSPNLFGTSYLASFVPTNYALTDEYVAATFDYPADVLVGSDISLSSDGKTFTINTDGWYTVMFNPKFYGFDDTADGDAFAQIDVSGLDPTDLLALMGPFSEESGINGSHVYRAMRTYQSNFKAGDTFQVVATAAMTTGEARFDATILVVRNA